MKKKRESIIMATIANKEELTQQLRAVAHMMTVSLEAEAYQYLNLLISQLEAGKDYCDSCGQVEWLCICEPIEAKEERSCEDCGSAVAVELEPYGSSFLAAISCPKCGVSYDTNLDPADIEALR
jgi:hypothetical protein